MNCTRILLFAMLCICLLIPNTVEASVEKPLTDAAKRLALELQSQRVSTVRVIVKELFTLSSSLPNTIREVVVKELKDNGLSVATSGDRVIEISPSVISEPGFADSVKIAFTLYDRTGQALGKLPIDCRIRGPVEVGNAIGLSVDASDKTTGQSRPVGPGHIKKAIPGNGPKPQPKVNGTVFRAIDNGMFGMELIVNGRPITPSIDAAGFAMVRLSERDTYEVRLINDANFDCLVALSLDGVDSGWFSESSKVLWVVRSKSSATIKGWSVDSNRAMKFEVGPPDESVAASLGQIGDVGVIQATFFRGYKPGEGKDPSDKGGLGTAAGDEFDWKVKKVQMERGKTARAMLSMRYDK